MLFELFDKLELATTWVQSLKNVWSVKLVSKLIRRNQVNKFLAEQEKIYMEDRKTDKVHRTWEKFREIHQPVLFILVITFSLISN